MGKNIAHIVFWVIVGSELLSHTLSLEIHHFTKPMLMPALLFYFKEAYDNKLDKRAWLVIAAILLSWGGDLLLMKGSQELFFILGLGSFLLAHVAYILVFNVAVFDSFSLKSLKFKYLPLILVYAAALFYFLLPASGPLAVPVSLYGLVIMSMLFFSLSRQGHTSPLSFNFAVVGAIFFVLSDSLLGINKFYTPIPASGFLIMSTYILGQYFIVRGMIEHPNA